MAGWKGIGRNTAVAVRLVILLRFCVFWCFSPAAPWVAFVAIVGTITAALARDSAEVVGRLFAAY